MEPVEETKTLLELTIDDQIKKDQLVEEDLNNVAAAMTLSKGNPTDIISDPM